MSKKHISFILVLLLSGVSFFYGIKGDSSTSAGKGAGKAVLAEKIYDGDTIGAVANGRFEKIRLIGIDAPEMGQRPWGSKARKSLESLVAAADSKVLLEFDVEQRDKYGRVLGYLWTQDGRLINEELLKKGSAVLFTFPPNVKYVKRLQTAQKMARDNKSGIWGENGLRETPYEYRKEHPRR